MIIASADVGDRASELVSAGASGIIRKPFDVRRLRQLLQSDSRATASADVSSPSPAATAATPEPLDATMVAALEELATLSPQGDIDDVIATFESAVATSFSRLEAAAKEQDDIAVAQVAHELAGTSANFGAHIVSRTCREVERLARSGDISRVAGVVSTLGGQLDDAVEALRRVFPPKVTA